MKREELLDAFSGVDEELLLESEEITTRKPRRILWRAALVAAICTILAVTATAAVMQYVALEEDTLEISHQTATYGVYQPVDTDGTELVKIGSGTTPSYKIYLDIAINEDAPAKIADAYLPKVPDSWELANASYSLTWNSEEGETVKDGAVGQYTVIWKPEGYSENQGFRFNQISAHFYTNMDGELHSFICIPSRVQLESEFVTIAEIPMLKVTIPGFTLTPEEAAETDVLENYMPTGETWLFWSNGNSIFKVQYPSTLPDETVEEILSSLYLSKDIAADIDALRTDAGKPPISSFYE